jgi:hypothetical protein
MDGNFVKLFTLLMIYTVFLHPVFCVRISTLPLRLLVFLDWDETAPPVQAFIQTPMKQVA